MRSAEYQPRGAAPRIVPLLASGAVSAGLLGVMLTAFDRSSPGRWLLPTPDLVQMVSQCDRFAARSARDACARQVVAVLLERQQRELLLAQR